MSKLLFDEQPLVIDKSLAVLIGLNEALVLQQINYWIQRNRKADKNFYEDKYWTYNTIKEWQEEFPFWSYDTVKRTLSKLRKLNILVTGNFNRMKADRTLWYTINYKEIESLGKEKDSIRNNDTNENVDKSEPEKDEVVQEEEEPLQTLKSPISANCPNAIGQNAPMQWGKMPSPIPEISTETSTEISFQSISQSKKIKDGLTDRPDQEIDYNKIIKNCEIPFLEEQYQNAVTHAVKLLCMDIENKKRIRIGENIIPSNLVKNDLEKLDYHTVTHAINKFKEASREREIKNSVAYLKSCIYNAIHEMQLDVDAELRYVGLI
ncbi:MAG: hypothetical protein WCZ27_05935 [Tissierellaceae bacterium]